MRPILDMINLNLKKRKSDETQFLLNKNPLTCIEEERVYLRIVVQNDMVGQAAKWS